MLIKQVQVQVKRDTITIDYAVKKYEVDILRAVHGDDDRFQINKFVKPEPVEINLDAEEEYQRLSQVYKRDFAMFQNVYRNQDELKKAMLASVVKAGKDEVEEAE
jgi:hypothetical protein